MATSDVLLDRMERFLHTRLCDASIPREKRFRPALTISRECGTGMDTIGSALVEYLSDVDDSTELGWALFDQRLIGKIIEGHDLPRLAGPFRTENTKFQVGDGLEELLNLAPTNWSLFNYVADTIRNLCKMGNAIIVGRAGNFVTSDMENTFHIRLVGSLDRRVRYTAVRHDISLDRAADLVKETDKSRKKFVERYIEVDLERPAFYHLLLNTDDFSPDTAARIIGDSLLEWAWQQEIGPTDTRHENVA